VLDLPWHLEARRTVVSVPTCRHTQQHEQGDRQQGTRLGGCHRCCLRKDLVELQRAELPENEEHRHEQTKITDAVGNEGFLAGFSVARAILPFFEPKPISR